MMAAASKPAQLQGAVKKTCTGCGRTKPIGSFGLHARFQTPMHVCDVCMVERRKAGGLKRSATAAAKRVERARVALQVREVGEGGDTPEPARESGEGGALAALLPLWDGTWKEDPLAVLEGMVRMLSNERERETILGQLAKVKNEGGR